MTHVTHLLESIPHGLHVNLGRCGLQSQSTMSCLFRANAQGKGVLRSGMLSGLTLKGTLLSKKVRVAAC